MPKEDQFFNSRLVRAVRKHSCLYNCHLPAYSNKRLTKDAWESVAEEMNDTVVNCKEKWRNLRIVFSRHLQKSLHGNSEGKITYYLYEQMEFLKPFVRCKVSRAFPSYTEAMEEITRSPASDHDTIEIKKEIIDTSSDAAEDHLEGNFIEPTKPILIEAVGYESIDPYDYNSDNPTKKAKFSHDGDHSDSNLGKTDLRSNYRLQFLQSLVPDVEEMTSVEFRKFRKEVIKVIDDVLDSSNSMYISPD